MIISMYPSPFADSKILFIRGRITDRSDMILAVGRGRKARKQTNGRTNTRTNILFTME